MDNCTLLLGDCLEKMDTIADNSVDMVLTDPPYCSGGLLAGERKASTSKKYCNNRYHGAARFPDFNGDNMDQRSFTEFMRMVFVRAKNKMKQGSVIAAFADWRQLPSLTDALQMAGFIWRGIVVWDKGTSRNIPGRYRQDCEYIAWGSNGSMLVDWTPGFTAMPGCYHIKSVSSAKKHHQTEKPVELLEKLLEICPEKGTVFDPFMGSGSLGVACLRTNRKFIGIEQMPEYFETAKQRTENFIMEV